MKPSLPLTRTGWGRSRSARRRTRWDEAAYWFRLRYPDAKQMQRVLNLVSRHTDRLGMRLRRENGVAQLYVGASTEAVAYLLEDMARDMGFRLSATAEPPPPLTGRFTQTRQLVEEGMPSEDADAYLVREQLFTLSMTSPEGKGSVFPEATVAHERGPKDWHMPVPRLGITTRPEWPSATPPELSLESSEDWALGHSPDGLVLGGRRVQVLGAEDSAATWLSRLIMARLARKPAGLVVIDGRGDLMPRLLAWPHFARLRSAKQGTYLDVNVAGQGGVNPLAATPDEELEQLVARWRWWFSGMGLGGRALDLLSQAAMAGISDLPALQQWLKGHTGNSFAAAASFRAVLEQLQGNQVVYRWLTLYPVDLQTATERGALFISCPHKGRWSRLQAIRAIVGQVARPGTDLILHQIPVDLSDLERLKNLRIVINTSTPVPDPTITTTILTHHEDPARMEEGLGVMLRHTAASSSVTAPFAEHAQCLRDGEALIARDALIAFGCFGGDVG